MLHVSKFRRAIDHHVDVIAGIGNDRVVENAAVGICHQTEQAAARAQSTNVAADNALQKSDAVRAVPANLTEYEYVEC